MPMQPCKKCNKNEWSYVKLDNDPHVYCTCLGCGYKTSFLIPKKKCENCQEATDFEKIDIDEKHRGKKCLQCGHVKIMEIATAVYQKIDGVMKLLWYEDNEFHEVALMEVATKKGTALQIIPIA